MALCTSPSPDPSSPISNFEHPEDEAVAWVVCTRAPAPCLSFAFLLGPCGCPMHPLGASIVPLHHLPFYRNGGLYFGILPFDRWPGWRMTPPPPVIPPCTAGTARTFLPPVSSPPRLVPYPQCGSCLGTEATVCGRPPPFSFPPPFTSARPLPLLTAQRPTGRP